MERSLLIVSGTIRLLLPAKALIYDLFDQTCHFKPSSARTLKHESVIKVHCMFTSLSHPSVGVYCVCFRSSQFSGVHVSLETMPDISPSICGHDWHCASLHRHISLSKEELK